MKIIDLLNKIANGEIENGYKFRYRNKIVTMGYLLDNYLFLEILNDEIESIEDTPKEEKKIPEKLDKYADVSGDLACKWSFAEKKLKDKINEIINYLDYLKSKGE